MSSATGVPVASANHLRLEISLPDCDILLKASKEPL
jgi:hypothetical protein